jgi:integrase
VAALTTGPRWGLAADNDLKIVQTMLGHSSILLTADTYTSVLPDLAHHTAGRVQVRISARRREPCSQALIAACTAVAR